MNKIKIFFLFVLISLCVLFVITAIIYLKNVKIYEDVKVELKGVNYGSKINIAGITVFNNIFDLPLSHPNIWQIRNAYFKKLVLKIEKPNDILNNFSVIINGRSFNYDLLELKRGVRKNETFVKEIPYHSNGNLIIMLRYVISTVLKHLFSLNIYLKLLIVFIFYILALWLIWKLSLQFNFRKKQINFFNKKRNIKYSWLEMTKLFFLTMLLLYITENVFHKYNEGNESFPSIDPLLGYSYNKDVIKNMDYDFSNNMILLKTKPIAKDTKRIRILITGGSTSDVSYDVENWPVYLLKLLEEKNYAADIYVGAVTGYNSGQELMKLLGDGLFIKPDVHISYSGINDALSASYVSSYEQNNYNKAFKNKMPWIMPHTINAFVTGSNVSMDIVERNEADKVDFFLNNISLMYSLAERNHYVFVGILQPYNDFRCVIDTLLDCLENPNDILQFEDSIQKNDFSHDLTKESVVCAFYDHFIRNNSRKADLTSTYNKIRPESDFSDYEKLFNTKLFYKAINSRIDRITYIYNFTNIFNKMSENPFKDRCHIKSEFQPIVAVAILRILEEKGIFCNKVPKNKDQ